MYNEVAWIKLIKMKMHIVYSILKNCVTKMCFFSNLLNNSLNHTFLSLEPSFKSQKHSLSLVSCQAKERQNGNP